MVTERRPAKRARKASVKPKVKAKKPFDVFEYIIELGKSLPPEELEKLPRDLAANFDHYQDGVPKQYHFDDDPSTPE